MQRVSWSFFVLLVFIVMAAHGDKHNRRRKSKPTPQPTPPPAPPLAWVPTSWAAKASQHGLVYAYGSDFRGLAWRGDPDTTSRSAQFANGYVGSVLGGPEYVPSAFCAGNRAPISASYNISIKGMSVQGIAMDMIYGAVEKLWCPNHKCETSVVQKIYAHEGHPHVVVSQLVANNTAGSNDISVDVLPAASQPKTSYVGGTFKGKGLTDSPANPGSM